MINNKINKLLDLVGGIHKFRESVTILVKNCTKNKKNRKRTNENWMGLVAVFKIKNESRQIKKGKEMFESK